MSEKKPDPANNGQPAKAGAAAGGAAVIRRVDAAEETSQERLMKKHVPAWVISGAVHVGLIAIMILMFGGRGVTAKPPEKIVSTSVEKEEEPPEKDLTNEDPGLQSNLEAALPEIERVDKQTVDAAVTMDNLGQPNAPETDTTALALPGLNTSDNSVPGVTGDTGSAMSGTGGMNGSQFASFPGRSGATKSRMLREGGGNDESERAVARGLAWLARQQKQDGGWEYDAGSKDERVAATGMALLPFLAAGETHLKGKKYQKTVASGLQFLLRNCPLSGANSGRMSGNMYAHAIGTLALCEAYGMTKDKGLLLGGAQAAINHIVKAQAANGSWGYAPGSPGDTSIVGWQIQALKAASLGKDIVVPAATMKKAVDFLNLAGAGSRKAMYGYADNAGAAPGTSLTAVGLLSRYYIDGWGPDNAGMAEGVTGLMKKAPVKTGAVPDMYFYYYATQVVHFFEGDEWKTWNEGPKGADGVRKGGMRDWLIGIQIKKEGPNEGSFDPDPHWIGRGCGRLGTTAMCILTLEVYYRHLPLYKRANAGDGALKIVDGAK
ncbi:prenyltransferase/squalene oxidase repeat-containing protein [Gemmata sp.]|uniref:prenyltransferase/squalene oxidase repeat-containing protein n=1 Tax=Gemmata sp. TaxID=1914242 RepID=UPI003F6F4A73